MCLAIGRDKHANKEAMDRSVPRLKTKKSKHAINEVNITKI